MRSFLSWARRLSAQLRAERRERGACPRLWMIKLRGGGGHHRVGAGDDFVGSVRNESQRSAGSVAPIKGGGAPNSFRFVRNVEDLAFDIDAEFSSRRFGFRHGPRTIGG